MSAPTGTGTGTRRDEDFLSAYSVTPRRKSHSSVADGGSLLLFGCGSYGLMTRQDEANVTTPTLTTAAQTWNTLVFGTVHAVATTTDGAVYTWGENLNGQLGLGDTKTRTTPTVVSALDTRLITNVGAGFAHSLFVSSNGAVLAAGSGEYGQTGINEQSLRPRHEANYDYSDHYTPAPCRSLRDIRITRVVCGERHSLALSSYGDVYACGEASQGALGLEEGRTWTRERTFVILFTRIPALAMIPIVGIAAGSHHSLAVTASGSAYSWGNSKNGKTGLGTTSICYTPKRIESLSSHIITSVHAGDSHSAFLSDSGALFMSGANNFGQLGTGDREPCFIPTRVAALMEHLIIQVACGSNHTLAVTSTHDVYAWGSADQGQLGIEGEVKSRTMPVQITSHELLKQGRPILAIAAGADTSAIIISHHINQPPIQPSHRLALPASFDRHHYTQLLTTATSTHDYTSIMSYISSVWSNPAALNASFMNRKGTGIAFDLLEHVYKSILRIATHESRMSTVLISAIQKSLNTLVQHMEKGHLDDPLSYRVIPIILQVPLLSMGSSREMQLLVDVAVVVRRMSQQARQQLMKWWSTMPPEVFASRLVKMMTHTLDLKLEQQRRALGGSRIRVIPEDVISIIELLDLLYQANSRTRLVPDSIFYMDGVQHVDFAHDYMTWRTVPPTKAQLPPFSFCRYPFLLHPVVKSEILRIENSFVQQHEMISSVMSQQQPYLVMEVRRDHLVDDVVRCINAHSPVELRLPLKVRFVGEEGIDQGGVSREFFTLLFSQLLDPKYALFTYNPETRTYWFNHSEPDNPSKRDLFYVAGLLLGMSLYNAVSINVSFPSIMYRLLLGGTATLEDFIQADPEAGRSLEQLLAYEGNVEEAFGLTFEVMSPIDTERNGSDVTTYNTVELIPNGSNIPVTNENRQQYVKLYVQYVLYGSVRAQLTAFTSGFHHLCRGHALSLLTPKDLELFITGEQQLNFHDLEKTTRYEGGYSAQHPTIQQFWSVLHNDLTLEEKKQFLVFVTGSARVPLGGLGELRMCIQRAEGDTERLPSAHTCFHTFLLPEYSSRDKLLSKLKLALQHSIGFGMR